MSVRKKVVRKLFGTGEYFTIAIRRKDKPILENTSFSSLNTLPATRDNWCADPMLAEDNGKTFLFYEKVHGDLGSIEVVEVYDDCSTSEPTVLFSDNTHYSYPYVFRSGENWYMIPETSAQNEVALYRAEQFPFKWKKERILLEKAAVDTTVFQFDGKWYLLSFCPENNSERMKALAYRMDNNKIVPIKWENYDPLSVRGAGTPFWFEDELYRPVQVSTDLRYGNEVAFVKMSIQGDRYSESYVATLSPSKVNASGQFYDGLHTYNFTDKYEVIDIRCCKLNGLKPIQKVMRSIQKKP